MPAPVRSRSRGVGRAVVCFDGLIRLLIIIKARTRHRRERKLAVCIQPEEVAQRTSPRSLPFLYL